jgi:elongation factor 1-alpha
VTYIPISSWTGENLIACSTAMPWYCGPNVLAALERVPADVSRTALPLRITVQEVFTVHNVGTVVVGRVESGVLRVLDHVLVMPGKHVAQISSIEQTYQRCEQALPGEVIALSVPGLSAKQVRRGSVVGHLLHCPPDEVVAFDAKISECNNNTS